jgi:hypothetical protein
MLAGIVFDMLAWYICKHINSFGASMGLGKDQTKIRAAEARSAALTPERRVEIARKAAVARWDGDIPVAPYEGEFKLGNAVIACAVLPNGQRIVTQGTFLRALGRSRSPKAGTGVLATADGMPFFLQSEVLRPFISEELRMSTSPVFYRTQSGGKGVGYDARLLPQVAEVYLKFRDEQIQRHNEVPPRYAHMVVAADILMRALANVGIIALVDEATGFQRDRAQDALAKILEDFIAKELRPWVRTFPEEFYEQLFRLKGVQYPKHSVSRPQYFGHLTNDIVYKRLAPGVLDELRKLTPRKAGVLTTHLHRRLSEDRGSPKLREHLASVVTIMKLSRNYDDFKGKLDSIHPRYGDTVDWIDDERGL